MTEKQEPPPGATPLLTVMNAVGGYVIIRYPQATCHAAMTAETAFDMGQSLIELSERAKLQRLVMEANAEQEANQILKKAGFKPVKS